MRSSSVANRDRAARWAASIGVLVVWTILSYGLISMFSGSHICPLLRTIPPGGWPSEPPPLTQAEMDAMTARCNLPNAGTLVISGFGYLVILAGGFRYI